MTVAQRRTGEAKPRVVRCAVYTRKSTEEGLNREFNSLDAQREAAEAFIKSQAGVTDFFAGVALLRILPPACRGVRGL